MAAFQTSQTKRKISLESLPHFAQALVPDMKNGQLAFYVNGVSEESFILKLPAFSNLKCDFNEKEDQIVLMKTSGPILEKIFPWSLGLLTFAQAKGLA